MPSMIGPRAWETNLFCYPIVSSIKHSFPVRLIFVTRKLDHRHIHTHTKKEASCYILQKDSRDYGEIYLCLFEAPSNWAY